MIVVAGGGPAGLAAAFRLREAGHRVRVLEAAGRAGGKLCSAPRDGFLVDRGAFFLPTTHRRMLSLAADAGIADELVPGGFVLATARDRAIHHLRGDRLMRDVATTRLLSARSKLALARLAPEVVRARRARVERIPETAPYDTETVAEWAQRALNRELAEYVAGATMRSIFGIAPESCSRVDFLAVIALFGGASLVAFRGGMGFYADALASRVEVEVGAEVLAVEEHGEDVTVMWRDATGAERTDRAAGCVVATPAQTAARIVTRLEAPRRDFLARVRNGALLCVNVGLGRAPAGMTATYIQVPQAVHPFLGGIGCDHRKAPGRAPAGKGLLTLVGLNDWCERHFDDHDDDVAAGLLGALEHVLPRTSEDVEFVVVNRWRQQYNPVGHYRGLRAFRNACGLDRRVQLAGEYWSSPNLEAATASGEEAARRLLKIVEPTESPESPGFAAVRLAPGRFQAA